MSEAPGTNNNRSEVSMSEFSFGSEVNQILNSVRRDNPELSEGMRVKRAWNAAVDQRIANHVTAVFIVPNTNASEVIVYVDDSMWAAELNMQVELLRLNLNMQLNNDELSNSHRGPEQVEKLSFKVSKEKYISKEHNTNARERENREQQRYKNAQPIELTDEEFSDLGAAFSQIDNDAIREIAFTAAKANLEWKKGIEKLGA